MLDGDAGVDSLLRLMQRDLKEAMERNTGTPRDRRRPRGDPKPDPKARPNSNFIGNVTPTGGYKSKLPDDDFIPDSMNPNPCKSASAKSFLFRPRHIFRCIFYQRALGCSRRHAPCLCAKERQHD